jgi:uncharacterized protein (TIGR00369 family)
MSPSIRPDANLQSRCDEQPGLDKDLGNADAGPAQADCVVTETTSADCDRLKAARATLAAQPFSSLMGARLCALKPGDAELRLALRPQLQQQAGFAHGAVLGYLVDNASAFAGGSVLGAGVVTAEYKISFLRPATGDELIARASVVHAGRSQAVVRCDVYALKGSGTERLCAAGMATISRLGTPRMTAAE